MKSFRMTIIRQSMKVSLAVVFACISLAGSAQMSGTYTITGNANYAGFEFETLQAAADSLGNQGVSGAVTINVPAGTYNERMKLNEIPGASASYTITFQPSPGDSASVSLEWDAYSSKPDSNYMIHINGADYVTIQQFQFDALGGEANYGKVIRINNNADYVTIRNNYIQGKEGSYYNNKILIDADENTSFITNDYLVIENNIMIDGETACVIYGTGSSDYALGVEVRNNSFTDQYEMAIDLRYLEAPVVDGNHVINETGNGTGIELQQINDAAEIINNKVELLDPSRGLYYYSNSGTSVSNMVLIANNFITLKAADGASHGIYLNTVDDIRVYHNSVHSMNDNESLSSYAPLYISGSGSSNIDVRNNILANFTGGYAYYVTHNAAVSVSDYNNYFTTGNYLAYWDNTITPTLAELQTRNTMDGNSLVVNPVFTSDVNLHTTNNHLDNMGDNDALLLAAVPKDIDGEDRGAVPDIGADEFTGVGTEFSGIYYIGGSGPHFASLTEAIDSLNEVGVDGNVFFQIRDDDSPYAEQVEILRISGADADNRVTFMPDPGNGNPVVITYDATSDKNYTIRLVGASYIDFKNLTINATNATYSTVINLAGMSSNDSIVRCVLNSTTPNSDYACIYSSGSLVEGIHVYSCDLNEGNYGIYLDGPNTDPEKPENITIMLNNFDGQYEGAVLLSDCDAPQIGGNTISHGASTYYYWGIELNDCENNFRVSHNTILVNVDEGGINIYDSDGDATFRGKVLNNFIVISGAGSSAVDGIYTYNADYVDIIYNTVNIAKDNTNTGSHAFYNSGGSHIAVQNNNFVNFGTGYAYYSSSTTAFDESDYNNFFSAGLNLAYWGGNMPRMSDLLLANEGKETHSYNMIASFLNDEAPDMDSPFLDTAGIDLSPDIWDDFYGQARSSTPSIGTYEYTASVSPITTGTYKIGTGEPTPGYETILAAFTDLHMRGISGPVVLEINAGDYNELIGKVFKIPGSSETNTVILKSASGNPEDVTIFYATDNADAMDIFNFSGVDNFIIRDLTITSTGVSYGRPLRFSGTYENITIENNHLNSGNNYHSTLEVEGNNNDVTIKDNTIIKGYSGIHFEGQSSVAFYSRNSLVMGNHISGAQYRGIYMRYHFEPQVIGNTIENELNSGFIGMHLEDCSEELLVNGNKIFNKNSDYGIYIYDCDATVPTFHGLVSNNVIHVDGTYNAYGIYISYSTGTRLYNNSIYLTSTYTYASGTRGIYTSSSNTQLEIVNNSVYNSGAGYAYYVDDGADIGTSNNNNWYSNGENTIHWGGTDYATLAAFRVAVSGMDENSVSLNPKFVSDDDLRSGQPGLHEKGMDLGGDVDVDIDSVSRNPNLPDIGAYEFVCVAPTFDLIVSTSCLGDSTLFIDNSMDIAPGSTVGYNFSGGDTPTVFAASQDDTLKYVFDSDGIHPVKYFVYQIAGCQDEYAFNVEVLPHPELLITTQGAYCGSDDGYAKVEVTNGEGPFNYFWSTNAVTDSIGGLALGTYTVAVSDTNGCSTTQDVIINEAIQVTLSQLSPSTCGTADGSAEVSATGGFGPYNYVWSNGDTAKINTTLTAGLHYVNVIDAQGCYAQGSIVLANDGTGPQISDATVVSNDCYGNRLGAIDITVSGGTAPYTIKWSNGETSEDIDNLAAGIYNVEVYDTDNCLGAASFEVTQPTKLAVSPVVENATCGGSDGSAVAVVSGGSKPYIYAWETGGIFQIEEGLAAGVYSVTVTDAKGCVHVEPVFVNNDNAPVVSITSIQGTGCTVTNNGSIDITVTGGIPPLAYSWTGPGVYSSTNDDISGLTPGNYQVEVSDFNGCVGVSGAVIKQEPPAPNPICLVTVDSLTQKNMVVWQKMATTDVSHYNIYRESSVKGSYQLIGSRDVDSLSYFVDSLADPTIRSWRYRISVVDDCGIESELSDHHKTIHLTMNLGLNDDINLIWDHYEGFNIPTYDLFKYQPATGWAPLTSISANNASFVDPNVTIQDVTYYIQVVSPDVCDADLKASTYNSSRSNRKSRLQGTGIESLIDLSRLNIYPNPSSGIFNLNMELEGIESIEMKVFDISGRMLISREFDNVPFSLETQIDLSNYRDGIYQVQLRTGSILLHRVIIKD